MSIYLHQKKFELLLPPTQIRERVATMAKCIAQDYTQQNPTFIVLLKGAFFFASDLIKQIGVECTLSFVQLSSYSGIQSSGEVKTLIELTDNITNRHVIIIEDIIDTGKTLHSFIESIHKHKPKSIAIATLLLKPDALSHSISAQYIGFEIPNYFVVGYGMDYDELGRNLEGVYQMIE